MNKFQMDGKTVKWPTGGGRGSVEPNKDGERAQLSIRPMGRSQEYRNAQRKRHQRSN